MLNPPVFSSPVYSVADSVISHEIVPEFELCLPLIPLDLYHEIQIPLQGFSPTTRTLTAPRSPSLEQPCNQRLFESFLNVSAVRMGHNSPIYIDLYRKYIPAMAQQVPALMESLLAIAALQIGMMKQDQHMVMVEATNHYQTALMLHGQRLACPQSRIEDATLATALMMTDYEVRIN